MSECIYRARILTDYTTGTNETGATQLEQRGQLGLSESVLTFVGLDNRNVDFLQNELKFTLITEFVFTPSGNPAAIIPNHLKGLIFLIFFNYHQFRFILWIVDEAGSHLSRAHGIDVRISTRINFCVQSQHGYVVLQVGTVEQRVDAYARHDRFDVLEGFEIGLSVPFAQSHFQTVWSERNEGFILCLVHFMMLRRIPRIATILRFKYN